MLDVEMIRRDFPILSRQVNGKPLVYLDNGASAQKPQVVIDAISTANSQEYTNVHRGLHYLSNPATDNYERVCDIVARFLGAASENEIVFNSGATEGINMVAYGWAMPRVQAGDEIILSIMEHHANIVPWHFLRERYGVVIKWIEVDSTGALDPVKVLDVITPRTKLIAFTHCSNVLGTVVDVAAICAGARSRGVPVLIDGSQAAVHLPINVQEIGCDFYATTGHKLYGPSGSGAIYVRNDRMAEARPSWLTAWALRVAKRRGKKRATVALARRIGVVLHRMWRDGTEFHFTREKAMAHRGPSRDAVPDDADSRLAARHLLSERADQIGTRELHLDQT